MHQWLQPPDEALPSVYETEHFRIIYWVYGSKAIDTSENGGPIFDPGTSKVVSQLMVGTGVPDVVQFAAYWLERGWKVFASFPMNMPPLVGQLINVYLKPTGQSFAAGGIEINCGTPRDYLAGTLLHELFHIFQEPFKYSVGGGADQRFFDSLIEGGANLAQDLVIDYQNEYINVANVDYFGGPLSDPRHTLIGETFIAGLYPYNFALFLKYYSEQQSVYVTPYNEPTIGGDAIHRIYQTCHQYGYSKQGLSAACASSPWSRAFCQFSYLDTNGDDLSAGETLLGNFWLALHMKDLPPNTPPDRRFTFMENVEPAHALKPLTLVGGGLLKAGATIAHYDGVPDYAASPVRIDIADDVDAVKVAFSSNPPGSGCLFQLALIDDFGSVRDIYRTDKETWSHTIGVKRNGVRIAYLYAVYATTDVAGQCGMSFAAVGAAPDLSITRWNCAEGANYEVDPFAWGWSWMSPDIWLNSAGGSIAEPPVAGQENQVFVRVRNQGSAATGPFQVQLEWQLADTLPFDPAGWQPITDSGGASVTLAAGDLAAGDTAILQGKWDVPSALIGKPVAIRVRLACAADSNVHNKRAVTIFGPALQGLTKPITIRRFPKWVDPLWDPVRYSLSVVARAPSTLRLAEPSLRPIVCESPESKQYEYELHFVRSPATSGGSRSGRLPRSWPQLGGRPLLSNLVGPDPGGCYPVDGRSLPPGLDRKALLTVQLPGPNHGIGFTVVGVDYAGARRPA